MAQGFIRLLVAGAAACLGFSAGALDIVVNGNSPGPVFEGIGALSAGASSRLLMDYPEPQRGEILDLLFKPGCGASFQHLKVEIGGDVNSTDGTEPSYARTREEWEHPKAEYFERGYEWWLMEEAKKRNPDILLDVLQWGAPEWVGEEAVKGDGGPAGLSWEQVRARNARKFYTQDNADFVAGFITGAKQYHGLDIDYCGIWNETPFDTEWIKLLRATLDRKGLGRVRIVAADQCGQHPWEIAKPMLQDKALMDAVQVIGGHYPGMLQSEEDPTRRYNTSGEARKTGKPLWSSEDGPWSGDWEKGSRAIAMMLNRNHVIGGMTKTIFWSLVTAYYECLPLPGSGPMRADTPWCGHYEVMPALYAIAHTTQFAQPGWRYLDKSCGLLPDGGSYVSLRSPGDDFSIIIETMGAKELQSVTLSLEGGLKASSLREMYSKGDLVEHWSQIGVHWGKAELTLEPEALYSLTTTAAGPYMASIRPPDEARFPMPYSDDFNDYSCGKMPKYFSDQGGIFEIADRGDGPGKVLRQCIDRKGIEWFAHPTPEPFTILGSGNWTNYTVSVDVNIGKQGYAAVYARINKCPQSAEPPKGYCFKLYNDGAWTLSFEKKELRSGKIELGSEPWHKLALQCAGVDITPSVDGKEVTTLQEGKTFNGFAGLGTGWNCAQFDNFAVTPEGLKARHAPTP